MADLIQEIRDDETQIANGPIIGRETSGTYVFSFHSEWPRNNEKAITGGGQQRAYFFNDELGKKLLSTSHFYKLSLSSAALKKAVVGRKSNKDVIKIKKDTSFTCIIKEGRITAITIEGASTT